MNNDIKKLNDKYEQYQGTFDVLSNKYENAIKEKMLMKLEKDRLIAKVESLETNIEQVKGSKNEAGGDDASLGLNLNENSPGRTQMSNMSGKKGQSPGKQASTANMRPGQTSSTKFV